MKRLFVVVLLGFVVSEARGDILLRRTIEKYEGATLQEMGWDVDAAGEGQVFPWHESDQTYQTQAHGDWSLYIYDPDDQSYANAVHEFPDLGMKPPPYMVEFYFYLENSAASDVDDLLLYRPTRYDPIEGTKPADITIELVAVTDIEYVSDGDYWMGTWVVHILDDEGTHEVVLESMRLDSWHKFQAHRHPGSIDLWVDGDSIGSYDPRITGWAPDTFLIGTVDAGDNGEAFWDDFIVTTVPDGEHPRVCFESAKGLLMEALSTDWSAGRHGHRSLSNEYVTPGSVEAALGTAVFYDNHFQNLSGYERMSVQNALITRAEQLKLAVKYQDLVPGQRSIVEGAVRLTDDVLHGSGIASSIAGKVVDKRPPMYHNSLVMNAKRLTLCTVGVCLVLTATQAQTDSIVRVGACATKYHPWSLVAQNDYLSLIDRGSFVTVDVSVPGNPQILGILEDAATNAPDAFSVKDTLVYVREASNFAVISIARIDSPITVGATLIPTYGGVEPRGIFVRDTIAFVSGGNCGLIVCNVRDCANPFMVDTLHMGCSVINLTMRDSLLFLAAYDSLLILNATDPANLTKMGGVEIPQKAYDVAVQGNYAYVAGMTSWSGVDSRLKIVNISDPCNPSVVGEVTGIRGDPVAVCLENGYAYVAANDWWAKEKKGKADVEGGIRVSVAHPDSESLVVSYDTPGNAQDVHVVGDLIYVADYDSVQILRHVRVGTEEKARNQKVSLRVWPSLFDERVNIAFAIRSPTDGRIEIYDKTGRNIRTLYDGSLFPANYRFHWNGRDEKSREVGNGEYFITVSIGNNLRETRKVTYFRQGGVR